MTVPDGVVFKRRGRADARSSPKRGDWGSGRRIHWGVKKWQEKMS